MKITENMTREERRAAIRTTTDNRDHLIAIHRANGSAAETVAELIGRIGYKAARETIAEAVNARGEWDGRISAASRAWAASIDTAADRDTLMQHYLISDDIHPAHVDQIAEAAAEYDREKPEGSPREYRRIRWDMLRAIARDSQDWAVDANLRAFESASWDKISAHQCSLITAIYNAWERGWCALEEAQAAEAAANLTAESAAVEAATRVALARAGLLAEETEAPAEEPEPETVTVDSLRADLDTGNYGEYLNDYRDSSEYISDVIHEIADNQTSIYYCDILKFISEHPDALADVIAEGLYDPSHDYDLYAHGQAAEYLTITRDLWDNLEDALMWCALDFIKYDLHRESIPQELADYLAGWVSDPGDRMDDIPDRIREYFDDVEEVAEC